MFAACPRRGDETRALLVSLVCKRISPGVHSHDPCITHASRCGHFLDLTLYISGAPCSTSVRSWKLDRVQTLTHTHTCTVAIVCQTWSHQNGSNSHHAPTSRCMGNAWVMAMDPGRDPFTHKRDKKRGGRSPGARAKCPSSRAHPCPRLSFTNRDSRRVKCVCVRASVTVRGPWLSCLSSCPARSLQPHLS